MSLLTIGEVARRAGIRTSAVRYYESLGILPEPERMSGQRRYRSDVLNTLAAVAVAKEAGFTMEEVRVLLSSNASLSERWESLANAKLQELDQLIARLQAMKQLLQEGLRCGCVRPEDCALLGEKTAT